MQALQGGGSSVLPAPTPAPAPSIPPYSSPGSAGRAGIGTGGALSPRDTASIPFGGTPGCSPAPPPSAPPVAPTAPPAPSSSPFDSDPGYQAALAMEQLGRSQDEASLKNLIQQRIIAYGDPALASMAGFGLDPRAAAFARQNYLSGNAALARIDKQHQNNLKAIINQLAGHGLIFSGDTGYLSGQEDQGYGNNVYDAQQQALADILGYRQNTLSQEQQLEQQRVAALQTAYQNYLDHPELGGYGQQTDTVPGTSGVVGDSNAFATSAQIAQALKRFNTANRKNLGY